MAHKLLQEPIKEKTRTQKRIKLPVLHGKFGFSFFVGGQEIFLGVAVAPVEIERIVRKRFVKTEPATVKVLKFD